jgi:hypothetical protein
MWELKHAFRILVRKPVTQTLLGKWRMIWSGNMKGRA